MGTGRLQYDPSNANAHSCGYVGCRGGQVAPPEEGGGHYDCPGPPGVTGESAELTWKRIASGASTVGHDTAAQIAAYVAGRDYDHAGNPGHTGALGPSGAASVVAEAVLADAVRVDPPRRALPTDSSVRKRTPICTGLIDYFPSALKALADYIMGVGCCPKPAEDFLLALRDRNWAEVCLMALCDLDAELVDPNDPVGGDLENVLSFSDMFTEFAAAFAEVAQVSWHGNEKHNPGQPLHHARSKSTDHPDCIARHHIEAGGFDGPMRHSACKLWRALAAWQLDLEERGAPMARGAK